MTAGRTSVTASGTGPASILLAARVRVIRAAADLLEQARIAGLSVWPEPGEIAIQVPETAGDLPSRTAMVARLAALMGCDPGRPPARPARLDSAPRALGPASRACLHPRQGAEAIMTRATITDRTALAAALRELKLCGMLETLDARLAQAHAGDLGHLDFLQVLCQDEISRRETTSLPRRLHRRFEPQATLEGFDFAAAPKLPAAQIRDLVALRWLQPGEWSPVWPGRGRQDPPRAGLRAPGHPPRSRRAVPEN